MKCFKQNACKLARTDLRTEIRAAAKGFAIAGFPCFADTFVQGGRSVLRMMFSAKTPRYRKPPKRWKRLSPAQCHCFYFAAGGIVYAFRAGPTLPWIVKKLTAKEK
jgi:hypothetical protein